MVMAQSPFIAAPNAGHKQTSRPTGAARVSVVRLWTGYPLLSVRRRACLAMVLATVRSMQHAPSGGAGPAQTPAQPSDDTTGACPRCQSPHSSAVQTDNAKPGNLRGQCVETKFANMR